MKIIEGILHKNCNEIIPENVDKDLTSIRHHVVEIVVEILTLFDNNWLTINEGGVPAKSQVT